MRLVVLVASLLISCDQTPSTGATPPMPPTSTPVGVSSPTNTPQPAPEGNESSFEEVEGAPEPEPELYQYEITIQGKVIDKETKEEIEEATSVFITVTGTHMFGSRYRFAVPSGSVLKFVVTAPGYERVEKFFKPRLLRDGTLNMNIGIGKEKGSTG